MQNKLLFWRVLTNKHKGQFGGGKIQKYGEKGWFLKEKGPQPEVGALKTVAI
ncbi:unannotated protein [freshwater metagenome]|uniref:Unannotated protein n=1 Tax=freshwater metagenome TaxID=449393 RepID=A0A6J6N750_9ZZZZ